MIAMESGQTEFKNGPAIRWIEGVYLAAATPYLAAARGIIHGNIIKTPRNRVNFLGEELGKKIAVCRGHDARES